MAPEAFEGRRSEQTDIWSVGVIFYQLLSGRLPFAQPDPVSLAFAIMTKPYDPLPPTIPGPILIVIDKALRKDSSERYLWASEMRQDLLLAQQGIMPPKGSFQNNAAAINQSASLSTSGNIPPTKLITQQNSSTTTSSSKSKAIVFVGLGGVIIIFGLVGLVFFNDKLFGKNPQQNSQTQQTPIPQLTQTPLPQNTPVVVNIPTPILQASPTPSETPSPTPSTSSTPVSVTPSSTPALPNSNVVKLQDFTFELKECRLSSSTVTCEIKVTNNKNDRYLRADPSHNSRMFDNFNNEYKTDGVQIANQFSSYDVKLLLISGVQTKVVFQFNKIANDATQIKRLYLHFAAEDYFDVIFSDVPLIK